MDHAFLLEESVCFVEVVVVVVGAAGFGYRYLDTAKRVLLVMVALHLRTLHPRRPKGCPVILLCSGQCDVPAIFTNTHRETVTER